MLTGGTIKSRCFERGKDHGKLLIRVVCIGVGHSYSALIREVFGMERYLTFLLVLVLIYSGRDRVH